MLPKPVPCPCVLMKSSIIAFNCGLPLRIAHPIRPLSFRTAEVTTILEKTWDHRFARVVEFGAATRCDPTTLAVREPQPIFHFIPAVALKRFRQHQADRIAIFRVDPLENAVKFKLFRFPKA